MAMEKESISSTIQKKKKEEEGKHLVAFFPLFFARVISSFHELGDIVWFNLQFLVTDILVFTGLD